MNKKVMAAAVAGALALPAAAMAQVTISGAFRMGLSQHSISNVPTPLPAARSGGASGVKANLSEWRFGDNVTQIIFQASEDLGGGLKATGRFEWRPIIDGNGNAGGTLATGTGNGHNWVGIESRELGNFRFGSVATYSGAGGTGGPYSERGLALAGNAGMTQVIGTGVQVAPGQAMSAQQANFGQGRHGNSLTWNSPKWGGFTLTGVWSTNNSGNESDLASLSPSTVTAAPRKGNAIVLAPGYASGPFSMQYIWFDNQIDGFQATTAAAWAGAATSVASGAAVAVRNVKAQKLWATYNFPTGFSLTAQWAQVTLTNAYTGTAAQTNYSGGTKLAEQIKWAVGGRYITGPHTFTLDYTKADTDKVITNASGQKGGTGGKMWQTSWMYELSKRTEVGLTYAKLTNDANNAYGPQDTASNALGGTNVASNAGESYTIWGANLTHKF